MITTHDILWGMVYPVIFAGIAIAMGRFTLPGARSAARWSVTLAIVGGFAIAFIGISGKLSLPPTQAQEWLPIMGAAALVLPIVFALIPRRLLPPPMPLILTLLSALLALILIGVTSWLVMRPRARVLEPAEYQKMLAVVIAGGVAWYIAMESLATIRPGGWLPLLLSGVFGGAALVLIDGGTQTHGEVEGGVALVLLTIAALSLWLRNISLARGGMLAIAIAGLGLLFCGHLFADVKSADVMTLSIAPLLAWVGEIPGIRGRKSWLRFAICAVLVLGVTAIAAVPAVKGLIKTMHEQSESTMY